VVVPPSGATDTKKIIVNTYEAPRLMKTLELLRKAYGEGDQVSVAIEISVSVLHRRRQSLDPASRDHDRQVTPDK